jgi:serine/threonine protein kinase
MGVVHLARQPGGERVALKVIRPHIVGDDEARERLAREVKSLRRIRSRRVAEIVDADPWGEIPFVATRYVPGLSLAEHVAEEGPIIGHDLTWFAWCLAEALSDVHACGVLHRDIKPANVLMEGRSPVLIDFGLARVADDPKLTHTGWLLGTPGYLAPEILHGLDSTVASDVHSWAATVAYAGIGRSPFGTGPSAAIMDRVRRGEHDLTGLPSPLSDVVSAALSPDPLHRPTLPALLSWLRRQIGDAAPVNGVARENIVAEPVLPTMPLSAYAVTANFGDASSEMAGVDNRGQVVPPTQVLPDPAVVGTPLLEPPFSEPPFSGPPFSGPPFSGPPFSGPPLPDSRTLPRPEAPAPGNTSVQPSAGEQLRRGSLLGIGAFAVGVAIAAFPYLGTLTMIAAAWIVRSLSLTASAAGDRQRVRGEKWYDGPQTALSSPWHLVASIPGTLVLVLWSLGIALAAGLVGFALALDAVTTLMLGGATFATALWWGPGGARVRGPLRRVAGPVSRSFGGWIVAAAVALAVVGFLAVVLRDQGIDWSPATNGPLSRGPQWPDWLRN